MKTTNRILALLLALCLITGLLPVGVFAADAGETTNQPFISSTTGGSEYFRIPALITTNDGTLVAAADARWNNLYDRGNKDTIVSYSTDNGTTWNYSFPNYIEGSGDSYNITDAAFLDPALAYDAATNTIYMLVDLFPGQATGSSNCIAAAVAGTGMDGNGHLLLSKTSATVAGDYYVGDYVDGVANILDANGNLTGDTVDVFFNVTRNGAVVGNLFTYDATGYYPLQTSYLYLTKSTDNGKTWSAPVLLNDRNADLNNTVKNDSNHSSETAYVVAPGRGMVVDGVIFFNCYSYSGSTDSQRASVIYSADGGETWTRTADIPTDDSISWSSESQLVQLSDGTYRAFFRNGTNYICYADTKDGSSWTVNQTNIRVDSDCQISALLYPSTVNGKQVILLSCPAGTWLEIGDGYLINDRTKGKIYIAVVNDDSTLDFESFEPIAVSDNTYQYSCMTVLRKDGDGYSAGDVAILYENGDASISYWRVTKEKLFPNATIGDDEGFVDKNNNIIQSVVLGYYDAKQYYSFVGLAEGQTLSLTAEPNPAIATAEISGAGIALVPVGIGNTSLTVTVQNPTRSTSAGDTFTLSITVEDAYTGKVTGSSVGEISYVLDTDGIDNNAEYIIVYNNDGTYYALTNKDGQTSTARTEVTIEDNTVTALTDETAKYILWKFSGSDTSYTIHNTDAYLYPNSSAVLANGANTCTVTAEDISAGEYIIAGGTTTTSWGSTYTAYLGWGYSGSTRTFVVTADTSLSNPATILLYKKTSASSTWTTDLSKLTEQISIGENDYPKSNDAGKYTAESWAVFIAALEAANTRNNQEYVSDVQNTYETEDEAQTAQDDIDSKTRALAQAISGLTLATRTVYLTLTVGDSYSAEASGTSISGDQYVDAEINAGVIDITATNVGATTLVDNVVTYIITVSPIVKNISVNVGGIFTATDSSFADGTPDNTDAAKATASVSGSTLTITGAAEGSTTVTVGNYQFNVTVTLFATSDSTPVLSGQTGTSAAGKIVTKLILSEGLTYQLVVPDEIASNNITWKIADESIATVDEKGLVTAVKDLGNGEYAETTLTVTVEGIGSYTIPVVVRGFDGSIDVNLFDVYISDIVDTHVYYVWNCDPDKDDIYEAQEGEVIYVRYPAVSGTSNALDFFAAPYAGYALSRMSASDSIGAYFLLHNGEHNIADRTINETSEGFYDGKITIDNTVYNGAGKNQQNMFNANNNETDDLVEMLENVIALGADGGMGFTRTSSASELNTSSVSTSLTFHSERLPSIEKTIVGVLGSSGKQADWHVYSDGMYATVGQYIFFQIDITKYAEASGESINYSSIILQDVLKGSFFTDGQWSYDYSTNTITINTLAEAQLSDDNTYYIDLTSIFIDADTNAWSSTYYVVYEIQPEDLGTTITNTAHLTYSYQAQFSSGSLSDSADAEASMQIIGGSIADIVIDFGLSVTIGNLTNAHGAQKFDQTATNNAAGTAGSVTITQNTDNTWSVTYTPGGILQSYDVVYLMDNAGNLVNYFRVYPATTVYYEESFINWGEGWSTSGTGSGSQAYETLGDKENNYGYDDAYCNTTTASNGTQATSSTIGASGTFTFTGTGFDLYANCLESSGYVAVQVKNSADKVIKVFAVDTKVKGGTSGATTGQTGDMYGLPIISLGGLDHGTYTVTIIKAMDDKPVHIDGIRIYGTIQEAAGSSSIYSSDQEDHPDFYELRDYVLSALGVGDETSNAYGTLAEMADQVYAGISEDSPVAAILAGSSYNGINVQDLLDNGPKNELFLYKGQTLVFKVTTDRVMQIGLKAPGGTTSYSISYTVGDDTTVVSDDTSLNSSVDMFYSIGNPSGTEYTYTITITNIGNNILSVTDLKICDDPSFSFASLTAQDIATALRVMGYEDKTEPDLPTVSGDIGDVNGDGWIDAEDASLIMQLEVGLIGETDVILSACDVNGDGWIDAEDASLIMQFEVGLIGSF